MKESLYILLLPLLCISAYTEIKSRRIPNWLTLGVLVTALASSVIIGGTTMLKLSFVGFLIGGGIFLPFCLAGVLGGGDLKLMAAVGAVVGYPDILWALYYTVLAGGALAVAYALWNGVFFSTISDLFKILIGRKKRESQGLKKVPTVPYGIAIGIGTLWALLMTVKM